jgi:hypothetical protein
VYSYMHSHPALDLACVLLDSLTDLHTPQAWLPHGLHTSYPYSGKAWPATQVQHL